MFLKNINFTKKLKFAEEPKGWFYWIRVYNKSNEIDNSIIFTSNNVKYNGDWYEVNKDLLKQVNKIYKQLNYE